MREAIAIFLLLLFSTARLMGQHSADTTRADSIHEVTLRGVTVTAQSILSRAAENSQPLSLIPRSAIQAANARDASDAVALAPGVFVRQYGGLGGLRSISLRGTSSQQTVMLVDGVRYQSNANGEFDLSNLPASSLNRVEVLRGGNAALYGSNALGGAMNFITASGTSPSVALSGYFGSFGEMELAASGNAPVAKGNLEANFSRTSTAGNYSFPYNQYGTTTIADRTNADFSNLFGRIGWARTSESNARTSISLMGYSSERGTPGAVVQGSLELAHARLAEQDLFGVVQHSLKSGEWTLSASASGRTNHLDYRDPDARTTGANGIESEYRRDEGSLVAHAQRLLASNGWIQFAAEANYARLNGNNLDPSAGSAVQRFQGSQSVNTNWIFNTPSLNSEFVLDAALRADEYSDVPDAVSPFAGVVWHPTVLPLLVRVSGSLNYRAPSFNEEYYLNYGNTHLKPERSASIDGGITYEISHDFIVEGGLFLVNTRDQIVAVPRSPVSWSAQNIGRVLSRGGELSASGTLFENHLLLRASYTLMRAEDRTEGATYGKLLVYSPQEIASGVAELREGPAAAGFTWQYASHRYSLPDNSPESALPHYVILGANARYTFLIEALHFSLRADASNLGNAQYQVIRNYPMPGRAMRIGLEVGMGGSNE